MLNPESNCLKPSIVSIWLKWKNIKLYPCASVTVISGTIDYVSIDNSTSTYFIGSSAPDDSWNHTIDQPNNNGKFQVNVYIRIPQSLFKN